MNKIWGFVLLCMFAWPTSIIAKDFDFYPGTTYDPDIPTLEEIVAHTWGEKITSHAEIETYLKALADATPKIQLREYGKTWEGRMLYYLIVASEENMARLDEIQS
ncbi:carboxypeptidase, partial [candidate division KSB1 bacterium]|nr:carboxypeptidase [candidate division KSB1 bacterium]NIR68545.1 carboxypeptidase [candidate division KSB1 bacterium]NIS27111.1 carboxypeptidase [candidate division KSB1 bacterium]NIT73996.1 carboxypeptidase [candidate division KSB1 bacterium]NIU27855.1 carboxypeptidase [candidate division KSB1 bacterium]